MQYHQNIEGKAVCQRSHFLCYCQLRVFSNRLIFQEHSVMWNNWLKIYLCLHNIGVLLVVLNMHLVVSGSNLFTSVYQHNTALRMQCFYSFSFYICAFVCFYHAMYCIKMTKWIIRQSTLWYASAVYFGLSWACAHTVACVITEMPHQTLRSSQILVTWMC